MNDAEYSTAVFTNKL